MTDKDGTLFARFALESKKIKKDRVPHKLFEPRKDRTLSVQAIDDLDCPTIKSIGKSVAENSKKNFYGWAEIKRSVIEGVNLKLCVDNDPHCGHATIRSWPEEKGDRLLLQQKLAAASRPVLLSSPC